jgi:2-dehydropantoate 2-reductase
VITSLTELPTPIEADLILVTVKSFDTEAAVQGLTGRLLPKTCLLSLQNGVGNEEDLAAWFPEQTVVAGSITLPVRVPQTGTIIVAKEKGGIGLAPFTHQTKLDDIAAALGNAGFTIARYEDYRSLKWSKLMMNIIGNATSAILDMPPRKSMANPAIFDLELAALRETLAVMQAQQITVAALPDYPLPWLARLLRWLPNPVLRPLLKPLMVGGRGDKLPSLQLDLRQGRNESEVTVLNSVVAANGERLNVAVPVNRGLSNILEGIVCGEIDWDVYRGRPDVLVQRVRSDAV